MTTSPEVSLVALAEAKAQRLRLFFAILAACAVMMCVGSFSSWYKFEYSSDLFAGQEISSRPVVVLDAKDMATVAKTSTNGAVSAAPNPQISQMLSLPVFVVAPLLGVAVSLFGIWLRSAAFTAFGLVGHFFGWIQLSKARWWFEQAPGRDNWTVSRGFGQQMFWFALSFAALSTVVASIQAVFAYRAARAARVQAGEPVEESAFDLVIRLITRSSSLKSSASAKP